MIKGIAIYITLVISLASAAQQTLGTIHSNYTPSNSVHINPSSMLDAKTWLDINIIGTGTYLNNDFIAAQNTSIRHVYRDIRNGREISEDIIYFNQNRGRYHAYSRVFAESFIGVWSQGNHAAGISFGGKAFVDVRRIDGTVAQFVENGVSQYTPQHLTDYSLKRVRVNALTYGQAQFSYAYTFQHKQREMFMGGISYKKIFPIVGGALSVRDFSYNVRDDIQMSVFNFEGDVMGVINPEFNFKGGWGIDLGFTYQRMYSDCSNYYPNSKRGGCRRVPYKWKLGVSLIDLGYAKFNPDNVNYVGYNFQSYEWFNYADIDADETNFPNVFEAQESNPSEGVIRKPHKMSLPTYLSVQFDYNIKLNYLFLNATWVHGIPPTKGAFGPRHAHYLSVAPRFEIRWFDLSIPFSLYEYRYPQIGLSARFYFLTLGTDKLLNWIIRSDVYGADFYFYLKVPIFRNPKCRQKGSGKKQRSFRGAGDMPHCDAYY